MATSCNSPKLQVTILARVLANGSHFFQCLSCRGDVNRTLTNEDDIMEHMATHHVNRTVRYWLMNANVYTTSYEEYIEWMNIDQ